MVSCAFRQPYIRWNWQSTYYSSHQICYSVATNNDENKIIESFRYSRNRAPGAKDSKLIMIVHIFAIGMII